MYRLRHYLGFAATLLAIAISIMPPQTPVTAEGSAGGWVSEQSGTTSSLYGVNGNSPSNVFACGDAGTIVHFDGSAWTVMNSGVTSTLYGLWCASTGDGFAVGTAGTILHYDDTSWSPMASGTSNHLNAVWGSGPDSVFAVGNVGTILHYDGVSWSQMPSGTTSHLRGVWGSSSSDVFAVGNGGVILHWDGISWASTSSGTKAKFYGVWGTASSSVLSVGEAGTMLRYDGVSWVSVSSGVTDSLNGVWGASADDAFVVGGNGLILHYDGAWAPMDSGTASILYGVWGTASFNVYAVGGGGTILHYHGNPPLITSVDPNQGYQAEALSAVISGTDFDGVSLVDFGAGLTVTAFSVDGTGTQIIANIAIAAEAPPGARDISVTTPGGSHTLAGGFTVLAAPPPPPPDTTAPTTPVVTDDGASTTSTSQLHAVWSASDTESGVAEYQYAIGTTSGGTDVVGWTSADTDTGVTRTDLSLSVGATYYFSVKAKNGAGLWSGVGVSDGIAVVAPPDTTAPMTPLVTDDGASTTSTSQLHAVWSANDAESGIAEYQYAIGTTSGGTDVVGWTSGGTDTWVTKTGLSLSVGATYYFSVKAKNGVGLWSGVGVSDGIAVVAPPPMPPTVTAVAPTSGACGETLVAVISGTGFDAASLVDFGDGVTVTAFSVDGTGTQTTANITIATEAAPGARDVSVTTPGGSHTLVDGFAVLVAPPPPLPMPPTVTEVAPASGVSGGTLVAVISGSGFDGASVVDFGDGVTVTAFSVDDSGTRITANITIAANATAGGRDVKVETSVGSGVLLDGFKVLIRFSYITEVSPRTGMIGDTLDIIISGANLDVVTAVAFGAGIEVNSFSLDSTGQISVRIIITPDAKAGYRDVSIVTPWNNYSHLEAFAVAAVPPANLSVGQTYGRPGEEMTVTIEGTNLVGVTRVSFGPGIEVIGFDMYPPSSLRVRIKIAPDAETGVRDVSVTTAPGGTCTIENAFEIEGPEASTPPLIPIGAAGGAILAGAGLFLMMRRLRRS